MPYQSRRSAIVAAAIIAIVGTSASANAAAAALSQLHAARCCLQRCGHRPVAMPRDCCCELIRDDRIPATATHAPPVPGLHLAACPAYRVPTCSPAMHLGTGEPCHPHERASPIYLLELSLQL